jgi:hypothetical protein
MKKNGGTHQTAGTLGKNVQNWDIATKNLWMFRKSAKFWYVFRSPVSTGVECDQWQ